MKPLNLFVRAAVLAGLALLAGSCNLGTPISKSPTEVEGLTGTLVVTEGAPASGAVVRVFAAAGGAKLAKGAETADALALDSVQANAHGAFLFRNLPNGLYSLVATTRRGDTVLALYLPGIQVVGNTNIGVDTLRVAGQITVQVTANAGAPVPDALCSIAGGAWEASSGDSGTCVLSGVAPGTYQVTVSHPSFPVKVTGSIEVLPGGVISGGSLDLGSSNLPLPTAPSLMSPEQNATGVPTTVALIWIGGGIVSSYEIQVATDSLYLNRVVSDTVPASVTAGPNTRTVGPLVGATRHYWRIRGMNATGNGPWSSRWFTTATDTTLTFPNVPVLVSPAQFSTGVTRNPLLAWSPQAGVIYLVQVSTNSTFSALVVNDSGLTVAQRAVSGLAANTDYFWRVSARNALGASAFSSAFRFTTGTASGDTNATGTPAAPALLTPAAFATGVSRNPTLVWIAVSGATSYQVQVASNATFANLVRSDSNVTATNRSVGTFAALMTYNWRVRAQNGNGFGPWSEIRTFTTTADSVVSNQVPGVPLLLSPAANAVGQAPRPVLSWVPSGGAASYRVQLAHDSGFTILARDTTVPTTAVSITSGSAPLALNTGYWWRVSAANAQGSSAYSAPRRFTTAESVATGGDSSSTVVPAAPVLFQPAQFATGIHPLADTLAWSAVSGATFYAVQVSVNSSFATTVVNDSTGLETRFLLPALSGNTQYYWRVRAHNPAGPGPYSSVFRFTTRSSP